MVVEPESLCWTTGRPVEARDGVTWAEEFARFPALVALDRDVLAALLDLEGLGRQPWRLSATTRVLALVETVQLTKTCADWPEEARRVGAVFRGVWRASGPVECVNSVARMQHNPRTHCT